VDRSLGLGVDMILDGGACPGGIESTVLDLTSDPPRVLRPGGVPIAALRAHLPDVVLAAGVVTDEQAVRASPGMDARHYAPRARLEIAPGREAAITRRRELGDDAALILLGGAAEQGALVRALPADPEGYGRELYATLHALDDAGARVIVVEAVPADEDWLAVRDRLSRASH
jgi:L-threonylcarbamoyladenylate synthase